MRGFETIVPPNLQNNFAPDRYFRRLLVVKSPKTIIKATFLADYSHPDGVYGNAVPNSAVASAAKEPKAVSTGNRPQFVAGSITEPASVPTAPPTPADAVVFDSFSRLNQTKAFRRTLSMGTTETGSAGQRTWMSRDVNGWGILYGRAVAYSPDSSYLTLDSNIGSNVNLSVGRTNNSLGATGLTFRYADEENNLAAFTDNGANIYVIERTAGNLGILAICTPPSTFWTTLGINANNSIIKIFADGQQICTVNTNHLLNAQKVGLMKFSNGTIWRWDNFTVKQAQ